MRLFALSCLAACALGLCYYDEMFSSMHQSAVISSKMEAEIEKTGKPICSVTFSLATAGGQRKMYTEYSSPTWLSERPYRLCEELRLDDRVPVTLSENNPRILWKLLPRFN